MMFRADINGTALLLHPDAVEKHLDGLLKGAIKLTYASLPAGGYGHIIKPVEPGSESVFLKVLSDDDVAHLRFISQHGDRHLPVITTRRIT